MCTHFTHTHTLTAAAGRAGKVGNANDVAQREPGDAYGIGNTPVRFALARAHVTKPPPPPTPAVHHKTECAMCCVRPGSRSHG